MKALYVLYDSQCGLCSRLQEWLSRQPAYVPMRLVASRSAEALRSFPASLMSGELAVVSDTGEAWIGGHAWVICLWALRDYRHWANRLSSPGLLPLARQAFSILSRNRQALSHLLGFEGDAAIASQLLAETILPCKLPIRSPNKDPENG